MKLIIGTTVCIDVCQSNRNLLASGGTDQRIKIFDKRESKIVKTFKFKGYSGKKFYFILVVIRY
jgi:WD40 repeat protein